MNNLSVYADDYITVPHPRSHHETLKVFPFYHFAVILVAVIVLLAPVAVLMYKWKIRMIHVKRSFTQKLENLDLDLVNSISNRKMLEEIADVTRDNAMEVERENITLLGDLGEGNFGLVRKAVMVQESRTKKLVAVKMLKCKLSFGQFSVVSVANPVLGFRHPKSRRHQAVPPGDHRHEVGGEAQERPQHHRPLHDEHRGADAADGILRCWQPA